MYTGKLPSTLIGWRRSTARPITRDFRPVGPAWTTPLQRLDHFDTFQVLRNGPLRGRSARRRPARGRSGGRHCTAGQSCYVPLRRHLVPLQMLSLRAVRLSPERRVLWNFSLFPSLQGFPHNVHWTQANQILPDVRGLKGLLLTVKILGKFVPKYISPQPMLKFLMKDQPWDLNKTWPVGRNWCRFTNAPPHCSTGARV